MQKQYFGYIYPSGKAFDLKKRPNIFSDFYGYTFRLSRRWVTPWTPIVVLDMAGVSSTRSRINFAELTRREIVQPKRQARRFPRIRVPSAARRARQVVVIRARGAGRSLYEIVARLRRDDLHWSGKMRPRRHRAPVGRTQPEIIQCHRGILLWPIPKAKFIPQKQNHGYKKCNEKVTCRAQNDDFLLNFNVGLAVEHAREILETKYFPGSSRYTFFRQTLDS